MYCHAPNYSYIVYKPDGNTSMPSQLKYITDIVLELKVKLVKIETEAKELKKQLSVIHLPLVNKVIHSRKSD